MKVSSYVADRLTELLNERRVVVWYDPARAFAAATPGAAPFLMDQLAARGGPEARRR